MKNYLKQVFLIGFLVTFLVEAVSAANLTTTRSVIKFKSKGVQFNFVFRYDADRWKPAMRLTPGPNTYHSFICIDPDYCGKETRIDHIINSFAKLEPYRIEEFTKIPEPILSEIVVRTNRDFDWNTPGTLQKFKFETRQKSKKTYVYYWAALPAFEKNQTKKTADMFFTFEQDVYLVLVLSSTPANRKKATESAKTFLQNRTHQIVIK